MLSALLALACDARQVPTGDAGSVCSLAIGERCADSSSCCKGSCVRLFTGPRVCAPSCTHDDPSRCRDPRSGVDLPGTDPSGTCLDETSS